jgi:hypothetical protein
MSWLAAKRHGERRSAVNIGRTVRLFWRFVAPWSGMSDKETRMSVETHLAELERRHRALDDQIQEAVSQPGVDDLQIADLKRRKLHIKDEIARLKSSQASTVH